MSAPWLIVEVEDSCRGPEPLGELIRVKVSPTLVVSLEPRSLREVEESAYANGCEMMHLNIAFTGCSRLHWERAERAVLEFLKRSGFEIKNRFDVSIEPKIRIIKYEVKK
jgi:hypothetical protein